MKTFLSFFSAIGFGLSSAVLADSPLVTYSFNDPSPETAAPFGPTKTADNVTAGPIERGPGFVDAGILPAVDEFQRPSVEHNGKVDLQTRSGRPPSFYQLIYTAADGATHIGSFDTNTESGSGMLVYQVKPIEGVLDDHGAVIEHGLYLSFRVSAVKADVIVTGLSFFYGGRDQLLPKFGQWEVALDDGTAFVPFGEPVPLMDADVPRRALIEKRVDNQKFVIPSGKAAVFRFSPSDPGKHYGFGRPFVMDDITLYGTVVSKP